MCDRLLNLSNMSELTLVALEAEKKFRAAASANEDLARMCQAQGVIISDIADSFPDAAEMVNQMSEMDKELELINSQIQSAQEFLMELLTTPQAKSDGAKPGIVLKSVIENTIQLIQQDCQIAAQNGSTHVSLLQILNIEDQINKLIQDMEERDMYPETESQLQQRNNRMKVHNEKIVEFLQLLKQATNK